MGGNDTDNDLCATCQYKRAVGNSALCNDCYRRIMQERLHRVLVRDAKKSLRATA